MSIGWSVGADHPITYSIHSRDTRQWPYNDREHIMPVSPFDFSAAATAELVAIPEDAKQSVTTYKPSPFDGWFAGGITPVGKGYSLSLPSGDDAHSNTDWRKALAAELNRAMRHYNELQSEGGVRKDGDPLLSWGTAVSKGKLIVSIKLKGSKPRKTEKPVPSANVTAHPTIRTGDAEPSKGNGSKVKASA